VSLAATRSDSRVGTTQPGRSGFFQVLGSERIKFWSVRSTGWSLLAMFVTTVGFGALICFGTAQEVDQIPPEERATFDATALSLAGLTFGQLAAAVLGVLVISSEYSTGGIRSSLVAVPRRLRLLAAKVAVLLAVVLAVGVLTSFVAFLVGQELLASADLETSLGEPGVLRAVGGGGLYLAASALFGLAFGTLLRQTAGGIVAAIAGLLIVPPLTQLLPGDWGAAITKWFTSNAGQQILGVRAQPDAAGPWSGYLVFCLWALAVLAVGAVLLQRRDAGGP
jgi:ABC-type transport system involved in multi-copper enzyme maturation permease subunit